MLPGLFQKSSINSLKYLSPFFEYLPPFSLQMFPHQLIKIWKFQGGQSEANTYKIKREKVRQDQKKRKKNIFLFK
jgi:hypothetical protein